jgi:hypothetical protein
LYQTLAVIARVPSPLPGVLAGVANAGSYVIQKSLAPLLPDGLLPVQTFPFKVPQAHSRLLKAIQSYSRVFGKNIFFIFWKDGAGNCNPKSSSLCQAVPTLASLCQIPGRGGGEVSLRVQSCTPMTPIIAYLRLLTPINGFFPEKKDCLFFMEGAGRDGHCRQINPLTNQILVHTGQKMNRTAELTRQNTYCQFGFSCYYLRSLPSNGGREKRPQISRLSECGAAIITSNYNPVFRGMLCGKIPRGFNQRKNCD